MKNPHVFFIPFGLSRFILLTLIVCLLTQCEHGSKLTTPDPTSSLEISADYALQIARAFNNYPQNKQARVAAAGKDSLIVDKTDTFTDSGNPVFHVLNYKNGKGWIIIAADRRITPVLAYSYSGKFDLANLGDGPKAWTEGVAKLANGARTKLSSPADMVEARWKHYERVGESPDRAGELAQIVRLMINICTNAQPELFTQIKITQIRWLHLALTGNKVADMRIAARI